MTSFLGVEYVVATLFLTLSREMQIRFRRYLLRKGRDVALFPSSNISFHFRSRHSGSSFAEGGGGGAFAISRCNSSATVHAETLLVGRDTAYLSW